MYEKEGEMKWLIGEEEEKKAIHTDEWIDERTSEGKDSWKGQKRSDETKKYSPSVKQWNNRRNK